MIKSQTIGNELKQPYMQIFYDLAIAKVALQIQTTEKPRFDDLFIHLGPFHVILAYFKAIGKFIIDCGLSEIMIESELLASGSMNGFIAGKHFNRCKRLHPLMALGLKILHFRSFLEQEKIKITEEILSDLMEFQIKKESTSIENQELTEMLQKYITNQEATTNGKGKTAQFYVVYINLVDYYFIFSRAIHMEDFTLYKYVLPKIACFSYLINQIMLGG